LDFRRERSSMFLKSMFRRKFELVGAVQLHAAVFEQAGEDPVHDGGADLALDVVAHDRDARVLEAFGPLGIARDEHRIAFTNATPASRHAAA